MTKYLRTHIGADIITPDVEIGEPAEGKKGAQQQRRCQLCHHEHHCQNPLLILTTFKSFFFDCFDFLR